MIPDYCEALTAYRCWNVYPNGLLVGQAHNEPWPPYQAMVARCGYVSNGAAHLQGGAFLPAPVLACDCGVHALKSPDATETRMMDEIRDHAMSGGFSYNIFTGRSTVGGRVWGAVKLWGRLIEHHFGYRAEFAYPSALLCEDEALARTVATLYGVPCAVKTLPRPEWPERDEDAFDKYVTRLYPILTAMAPPSTPQPTGIIALGLSSVRQQQAANHAALRAAVRPLDWRDLMKKAFHVAGTPDVP